MIARHIRNCRECASLKLIEEAKKMINSDQEVINLAIENLESFDFQDEEERADRLSLEEKLSEKLRIEDGLDYSSERILITNGIRSSLSLALHTILNPQDEVIIPIPYSPEYPEMVKLAFGKPILVKTQASDQYKLTPKLLKKAITTKTRAIIFNTPVNPTGMIYSIDELLELSEIIIENKITLISDESYEPFIYQGKHHISIASLNSRIKQLTILINDFSRASKEREWDLAYVAANKTLIKGMKKLQNYMMSEPNDYAKRKALMALESRNKQIDKIMVVLNKQRKEMIDQLGHIKILDYIEPQGAFYILVNISEVLKKKKNAINSDNSEGFCQALLNRSQTLAMPGEIFGMPGTIRLCFAVDPLEIEKGLKCLDDFIEKY